MSVHRYRLAFYGILFLFLLPAWSTEPLLTREKAVASLFQQIAPDNGSCAIWCAFGDFGFGSGFEGLLPAGTRIHPQTMDQAPYRGTSLTLTGPAYLFLVDDDPASLSPHSLRYVYLDATLARPTFENEGIFVQIQGTYPLVQCPGDKARLLIDQSNAVYLQAGPLNPSGLILGEPLPADQDPVPQGLKPKCTEKKQDKEKTIEKKKDLDQDGKYDHSEWKKDLDCDGNFEKAYVEDDADEDGTPEKTRCCYDDNDDGTFDRRYDHEDTDDDGHSDTITCYKWNGTGWEKEFDAPKKTENAFRIEGGDGDETGGARFVLIAEAIRWQNPGVHVFAGSQALNTIWISPTEIQATTEGYFDGTHDLMVVDFDQDSPSYGYHVLVGAITRSPILTLDSVSPNQGACNQETEVTISGLMFQPDTLASINGEILPTQWIDSQTLIALVPPGVCGDDVTLSVWNESLGPDTLSASLEHAFSWNPDGTQPLPFPQINCPEPLTLIADHSGFARIPRSFAPELDHSGLKLEVHRQTAGALPIGRHLIGFEIVNQQGNRQTCEGLVEVLPQRTSESRSGEHHRR